MTPVYQRIVDADRGDCLSACVASILDLPLASVPAWLADAYDAGFRNGFAVAEAHYAMLAWLRNHRLGLITQTWKGLNDWRGLVGIHAIATMPSQRFPGGHAVVIRWYGEARGVRSWEIIHDPNPQNGPYSDGIEPSFLEFLVPMGSDPKRDAQGEGGK